MDFVRPCVFVVRHVCALLNYGVRFCVLSSSSCSCDVLPDADAAENSKLRAEVERLTFELDELRVMLHESRDAEAKAAGDTAAKAAEISELEQRF